MKAEYYSPTIVARALLSSDIPPMPVSGVFESARQQEKKYRLHNVLLGSLVHHMVRYKLEGRKLRSELMAGYRVKLNHRRPQLGEQIWALANKIANDIVKIIHESEPKPEEHGGIYYTGYPFCELPFQPSERQMIEIEMALKDPNLNLLAQEYGYTSLADLASELILNPHMSLKRAKGKRSLHFSEIMGYHRETQRKTINEMPKELLTFLNFMVNIVSYVYVNVRDTEKARFIGEANLELIIEKYRELIFSSGRNPDVLMVYVPTDDTGSREVMESLMKDTRGAYMGKRPMMDFGNMTAGTIERFQILVDNLRAGKFIMRSFELKGQWQDHFYDQGIRTEMPYDRKELPPEHRESVNKTTFAMFQWLARINTLPNGKPDPNFELLPLLLTSETINMEAFPHATPLALYKAIRTLRSMTGEPHQFAVIRYNCPILEPVRVASEDKQSSRIELRFSTDLRFNPKTITMHHFTPRELILGAKGVLGSLILQAQQQLEELIDKPYLRSAGRTQAGCDQKAKAAHTLRMPFM